MIKRLLTTTAIAIVLIANPIMAQAADPGSVSSFYTERTWFGWKTWAIIGGGAALGAAMAIVPGAQVGLPAYMASVATSIGSLTGVSGAVATTQGLALFAGGSAATGGAAAGSAAVGAATLGGVTAGGVALGAAAASGAAASGKAAGVATFGVVPFLAPMIRELLVELGISYILEYINEHWTLDGFIQKAKQMIQIPIPGVRDAYEGAEDAITYLKEKVNQNLPLASEENRAVIREAEKRIVAPDPDADAEEIIAYRTLLAMINTWLGNLDQAGRIVQETLDICKREKESCTLTNYLAVFPVLAEGDREAINAALTKHLGVLVQETGNHLLPTMFAAVLDRLEELYKHGRTDETSLRILARLATESYKGEEGKYTGLIVAARYFNLIRFSHATAMALMEPGTKVVINQTKAKKEIEDLLVHGRALTADVNFLLSDLAKMNLNKDEREVLLKLRDAYSAATQTDLRVLSAFEAYLRGR